MRVTVMAAVARNGVIGRAGRLPWHLPDDLRRFKAVTIGHVLVMGRRTYESIGRPLPGRTTVVVTRRPPWPDDEDPPPGVRVAGSVPEALLIAGDIDDEVFVQGGSQVYAEALPVADRLLVTEVDAEPAGDTFFPEVDWTQWHEASREAFPGGAWVRYERLRPAAEKYM